jgi:hypothetical protein
MPSVVMDLQQTRIYCKPEKHQGQATGIQMKRLTLVMTGEQMTDGLSLNLDTCMTR